jgi:hypothetical protein
LEAKPTTKPRINRVKVEIGEKKIKRIIVEQTDIEFFQLRLSPAT